MLSPDIVAGVIQNARDEYLIYRKPANRGVFPGRWALSGGGIEPGERMQAVLRREIKEWASFVRLDRVAHYSTSQILARSKFLL